MRFLEIYRDRSRPILSFEVFPPKGEKALASLWEILPELVALDPDFMTVTYGAMGTTRDRTLEIAALIQNDFRMRTACHLTCVGSSRAELKTLLQRIRNAGIRNIVALRGDPPLGEKHFESPPDGLSHADELVAFIHRTAAEEGWEGFGLAVAGYPEKHVEAPDAETDLRNLRRKTEAGAQIVLTQLFYDNAAYFTFVERARAAGIRCPIVPGLLPIVSVNQIKKITSLCGATIPPRLLARLEAAGEDHEKAIRIGVEQCVEQARGLLAAGVPGIHFYVLNRSSHIQEIIAGLGGLAGQRGGSA